MKYLKPKKPWKCIEVHVSSWDRSRWGGEVGGSQVNPLNLKIWDVSVLASEWWKSHFRGTQFQKFSRGPPLAAHTLNTVLYNPVSNPGLLYCRHLKYSWQICLLVFRLVILCHLSGLTAAGYTYVSTKHWISNNTVNQYFEQEKNHVVYSNLYNNQINACTLIGQSAVGYCAGKPTEKLCVFWIII